MPSLRAVRGYVSAVYKARYTCITAGLHCDADQCDGSDNWPNAYLNGPSLGDLMIVQLLHLKALPVPFPGLCFTKHGLESWS